MFKFFNIKKPSQATEVNLALDPAVLEKLRSIVTSIKVLGSGCARCHQLYENTKEAVESLGLAVSVEYVTDMQKIMAYNVVSTPVLVINEKIVASGRLLEADEVESLLLKTVQN